MNQQKLIAFLFLSLFIGSCSSKPVNLPRGVASSEAIDEIDPKFETYFNDDAKAEAQAIQDVGKVIGKFVQNEAKIHQEWAQQLVDLEKLQHQRELNEKEKRKLKALNIVISDIPHPETLATRDVHRRPQGCFAARLTMNSDIPQDLQKGLFIPGKTYDAIVRYSNGHPRNRHDFIPDARGMAVKILDEGTLPRKNDRAYLYPTENLDGIDAADINSKTKLDLLAINFPVFFVNDPVVYTKVNDAFLRTSQNPEANLYYTLTEGVSVYLTGMSRWEKELALDVNGSIITNPLVESYWSMMAYRLGDFKDESRTAIKYKFTPCAENLPAEGVPEWTKFHGYSNTLGGLIDVVGKHIPRQTIDELSREDNMYYLRKTVYSELAKTPKKCFTLEVQRYLNAQDTSIEDTRSIWLETEAQQKFWADKVRKNASVPFVGSRRYKAIMKQKLSPPVSIGHLDFYPVNEDEAEAVKAGTSPNKLSCEDLSFNPWNNVPNAHKPLGIVGRMRKAAYSASRDTRHKINKVSN